MKCSKCGVHCSPLCRSTYGYFTCDKCGKLHVKEEKQSRLKIK